MLLARFALVALPLLASQGLFVSLTPTIAPPVGLQTGMSVGGLHGPHLDQPGVLRGQLLDANGVLYTATGMLQPAPLDAVSPDGFTPVGTVQGALVPTLSAGAVGYVEFFGHYSMNARGVGEFHVTLFRNATSAKDPGEPLGEWSARFEGANQLWPTTDLAVFGDFRGAWSLTL